ncbi:hypothetical protein D0869_02193 [Hortaea werneckii]|uniref:Uncharacterized protein n=1 Tax=Hortaea werneckii TaxID=91943 RepID=A0A3M6ZEX9_HORWE|nr:hypothetical protein KC324_g3408 [Hortaea werneckii]KAI7583551.1 hypothetical protein KC316_g7208 [Hortaea werneckii]RMX87668.1 hypothetical protein D0869_02193 [Hortaea werneckii]RMY13671.1 hypothetical protein D0868_01878 [Hortaea werneckii]
MAPKSTLLTAATAPTPKPPPGPRHALTTQDKIAKVTAQQNKAKQTVSCPHPSPMDPKIPPKKRSFPTPDELLLARHQSPGTKKSTRPNAPLTTQDKIRMVTAKERAKDGATKLGTSGTSKPATTALFAEMGKGRSAAEKKKAKASMPRTSTTETLKTQEASAIRFQKKQVLRKVTMRRTQKAERFALARANSALKEKGVRKIWECEDVKEFLIWARSAGVLGGGEGNQMGKGGGLEKLLCYVNKVSGLREKIEMLLRRGVLPGNAAGLQGFAIVDLTDEKTRGTFRFMDLPKEVQANIYRSSVVESKVFVRPDSMMGREQPDLAMVSRQLRDEVLPIFYAENVFAIDLVPMQPAKAGPGDGTTATKPLAGLLAIEKWAKMMQKGNWLKFIRHWVFDYAPLPGQGPFIQHKADSIGLPTAGKAHDDGSLTLSLRITPPTGDGGLYSGDLQVHQDACCLMPGFQEFQQCTVQVTPSWLNQLVIELLNKAKLEGGVSAKMIVELSKVLEARVHALADCRCEKSMVKDGLARKF